MPQPGFKRLSSSLILALGVIGATSVSQALTFNFIPAAGTDPLAIAGFTAAGARWSALFSDPVTVNINIGYSALGAGILASTGSTQANYTYTNTKTALTADKTSAADNTAVANLPAGASVPLLINRTSDNPNGSGSATAYLDNNGSANNSQIRMTNANAKALGLLAGNNPAVDASMTFNNAGGFTWDFDPTNGITAGQYDFVGIATHEIGHALGFISGVDILDINSPPVNGPFTADQFTFVSTLDLFRHSAAAGVGVVDWTASTSAKYFSLDGGATVGAGFSLGRNFGDGQQASHFKDSLGLGIMDPTAGSGELLAISANDITAFDAIGWTLAGTPPPGTPDGGSAVVLFGLGLVALASLRKRIQG